MHMCVYLPVLVKATAPGCGVTGVCTLPNTDAKMQTQVFGDASKGYEPLSHLSGLHYR